MNAEESIVANITLSRQKPTKLSFDDLQNWVIWQFPRRKETGLCGAVRPSIADHGWYPAIIYPKEEQVMVYAHLETHFSTPEEASESLSFPTA